MQVKAETSCVAGWATCHAAMMHECVVTGSVDLGGVVLSMCNGPCVGSQQRYPQRLDQLAAASVRPFVWVLFVFLALAELFVSPRHLPMTPGCYVVIVAAQHAAACHD